MHVDIYADKDYNTCKIVNVKVILIKCDSLYWYTPSQVHFNDEIELQRPEVVPGHRGYPKNPDWQLPMDWREVYVQRLADAKSKPD